MVISSSGCGRWFIDAAKMLSQGIWMTGRSLFLNVVFISAIAEYGNVANAVGRGSACRAIILSFFESLMGSLLHVSLFISSNPNLSPIFTPTTPLSPTSNQSPRLPYLHPRQHNQLRHLTIHLKQTLSRVNKPSPAQPHCFIRRQAT